MALDKKLAKEESKPKAMSPDEIDLRIGVLMGQRLLEDGGFNVIEKALEQSKDPSQVIGQFLMQLGQQLMESMPEDVKLSPAILLARGGWLEQMSDYIKEQTGASEAIMDKAEIYVASTAQKMAAARNQQQQAQAPATQEQAAPMPLEGAM